MAVGRLRHSCLNNEDLNRPQLLTTLPQQTNIQQFRSTGAPT